MGSFKNLIAELLRSCTTFKKKDEREGYIQETVDGNSPNQARILDLPTSILIEIFVGLSIKTILCCRCVCKKFSAVLRDTDFLDAYQMKPNLTMILEQRGEWFYPFDLLELADDLGGCTLKKPVLANIPPNGGRLYVLGSCNGLVCIAEAGGLTRRFIYICNPILGEYSKLPIVGKKHVPVSYGFGFDPSTDHYKVVRILAESTPNEGAVAGTYAEIFTVGVDVKWRLLKHANGPNISGSKELSYLFLEVNQLFESMGLLFQGTIHWIIDHRYYWFDRRTYDFICAFDIVEEKFRSIPDPFDMIIKREDSYSLLVLRNHLSILTFVDKNKLNIWTMREYGVVDSWSKEYSIIENWISRCRNCCSLPISAIMRGDVEILMFSREIGVICYNLEEMKYTETKIANIYMLNLEHTYCPILFSLNDILSGEGVKLQTLRKAKRWFSVE